MDRDRRIVEDWNTDSTTSVPALVFLFHLHGTAVRWRQPASQEPDSAEDQNHYYGADAPFSERERFCRWVVSAVSNTERVRDRAHGEVRALGAPCDLAVAQRFVLQ
jgi:hypothetical protein